MTYPQCWIAASVVFMLTLLGQPLGVSAGPTTRPVEVTVVDRITQQPVADADVVSSANGTESRGKTDAAGKAIVSAVDSGWMSIEVTAPPHASLQRVWNDPAKSPVQAGRVRIELEPGITIGGKVVDDAGAPIAGATVVLHVAKRSPDRTSTIGPCFETTKTGSDGRWSYSGVPADPDIRNIGYWHHRYISTFDASAGAFPMSDHKDLAAFKEGSATFTLKRGVLIEGDVRDQDGKPLAGASIGLGQDRVASNALPEAETDAAGHFAIATHPTGTAYVTIKAKGHAPELIRVQMDGSNKTMRVDLKPGQVVGGRVVDTKGNPVPQAWIWIDTWRGCRTIRATLHSDSAGRFTWNEAPADAVQADAEAQGYARLSNAMLRPGAENVLTLMVPATVRGTVVDEATGQPVRGFKVITGIDWGNGQRISWERRERTGVKMDADGRFELTISWPYPGHKIRVEAEGYLPEDSPTFKIADGDQSFTFKLKKGKGIAGVVADASGKPMADVTVTLVTRNSGVQLINGELPEYMLRDVVATKSGKDGAFAFPPQVDPYEVVAVHSTGFAQVKQDELTRSGQVKLQPWGRIEGQVFIGSKAAAEVRVVAYARDVRADGQAPQVYHNLQAKTDANGKFVMERVPAGKWGVGREVRQGNMSTSTSIVIAEVQWGGTVPVKVGGAGRPVVGQVEIPAELRGRNDWQFEMCRLDSDMTQPKPNIPADVQAMEPAQRQEWYAKWSQSEEGKAYTEAVRKANEQRRSYPAVVTPDGKLRIEDVLPGDYRLTIGITRPPEGRSCGFGQPLGGGSVKVTMPEIAGGQSDAPLEAPTVKIQLEKLVEVGQAAPSFETQTLDGKPLKLADYRGKFVLLDFWATWCGPCVAELPNLKAAYEAFSKDPRLAVISLSLDEDAAAPRKFAEKNGMVWSQGFLGKWDDDKVTKEYGVKSIPSLWLIGPDGKVVAKDLRGEQIRTAVEAALKAAPER
ncbi:MAG: carboxypeptidase regulatory-like domain-containing protein [Bacillota bacterium]